MDENASFMFGSVKPSEYLVNPAAFASTARRKFAHPWPNLREAAARLHPKSRLYGI